MDDLYLALFLRGASLNLERQARALASEQPLRALWEFSSEPAGAALTTEFLALANRRPAIRAEISAYAEQFRSQQAEALSKLFASYGIPTDEIPPTAVLMLMSSIVRVIVLARPADGRVGEE